MNCSYFTDPFIKTGADGENFFGKSESSSELTTLQDRNSLMSNIHYHVYFQKVVFKSLEYYYPYLKDTFIRVYSQRIVSQFIRIKLNTTIINYLRSVLELFKINVYYEKKYLIIIFLLIFVPNIVLVPLYKYLIKKYRKSGG